MHETLLWNVRVLGGWVPRDGRDLLRVLLAPFEIAERRRPPAPAAGGGRPPSRTGSGSLGTAWPRLARPRAPGRLRRELATSAVG